MLVLQKHSHFCKYSTMENQKNRTAHSDYPVDEAIIICIALKLSDLEKNRELLQVSA